MAQPLTDAINSLITYSNSVTGQSDVTLSDCVATLASGYGGGGIDTDAIATGTQPSGAITLSSSVTSIVDYAFAGSSITSITAPSVTSIGTNSLQNTQITSITDDNLPSFGVNSIGMIWLRCRTLQNIKLSGERITLYNGSGALRDNTALVRAEFPNAAKNVGASYIGIGNSAFYGDTNLEFLDAGFIHSTGGNCFYNCRKLQTLILRYTSVVSTNTSHFTNTPFRGYNGLTGTVYCPQSLVSSYQTANYWSTMYNDGTCTFVAIEGSQYE